MDCPRPNVPSLNAKSWLDVHYVLRDRLWTARVDAAKEGLRLELNSGGRSDGQQWDLRRGRVPRGQECNPAYKGSPTTAVPGRSRHRNLSFDISAADMMGTALGWLHRHQREYGIHFPVPGEAWHAEPTRTAPTKRTLRYGTYDAPADPNEGRDWRAFAKNVTDKAVYNAGGHVAEVTELQRLLKELDFYWGRIDGLYYAETVNALIWFKEAASWKVKGKKDRSSGVTLELIVALRALAKAKKG